MSADVLNMFAFYHLLLFGVLLPLTAMRSRKKLFGAEKPVPNRLRQLKTMAINLGLFTAISLIVAQVQGIPLFPRTIPPLRAIAAGVAMYSVLVLFMGPRWRKTVEARNPVAHLFMPENATERVWWVIVSFVAGIGEEITWRLVQPVLLIVYTGSYGIAAILSAVSFAMTHAIQGWKSASIIFAMALAFHGLVWLAGSLYVAMVVHVVYDVTAGLTLGRLGRELGYRLEPMDLPVEAEPTQPPLSVG